MVTSFRRSTEQGFMNHKKYQSVSSLWLSIGRVVVSLCQMLATSLKFTVKHTQGYVGVVTFGFYRASILFHFVKVFT